MQWKPLLFFSSDPSDDETIEKPSDKTAIHQDPDSKPAVKKKRKQVCKFSNYAEHLNDTVSGNVVPILPLKGQISSLFV